MSYIQPKMDYKDGDVLYGIDLNASNEVIKRGVDDNFDRIQELSTNKQDKLTAGEGIEITEENVINNTQTSAEWGNVQGDINAQEDLQTALSSKVDKVEGKGLSTEDYTYNEKIKLSNIESGAEVNTIDTIKVDGNPLSPINKEVNIDLSGKQDTLESGVNIKTINNQNILGSGNINIGGGSGGTSDYDQLENRPQINNVTLSGNKSLSDLGINIPTSTSDLNNNSGFIDKDVSNLTHYTSTTDMNTALGNKVDKVAGKQLSTEDYTTTEKSKLSGIEAGAEVNVSEIAVGTDTPTANTKLYIETMDLDAQFEEISDIYSTDEVKTNKIWIDGSPIYRKCFQTTSTANINTGIENDTITKMDCLVKVSNDNIWRNLPWLYSQNDAYGTAAWAGGFYYTNGQVRFQLGSYLADVDKIILIMEYTKTTTNQTRNIENGTIEPEEPIDEGDER